MKKFYVRGDRDIAASVMGISVPRTKLLAFFAAVSIAVLPVEFILSYILVMLI